MLTGLRTVDVAERAVAEAVADGVTSFLAGAGFVPVAVAVGVAGSSASGFTLPPSSAGAGP